MFNSRLLIAALFMTSALTANAQTPATQPSKTDPARFTAHKQKALDRIAHHLQVIQTLQSCVQSATDHASMKACHETARSEMKRKK